MAIKVRDVQGGGGFRWAVLDVECGKVKGDSVLLSAKEQDLRMIVVNGNGVQVIDQMTINKFMKEYFPLGEESIEHFEPNHWSISQDQVRANAEYIYNIAMRIRETQR
jgi:hypothetical protein